MVAIDLLRNRGDELDDGLGVMVTWGSLTTDADDSWDESASSLVGWGIKNGQVSVDDVEDVHELSLVLVDSLDLHIVESVEWHIEAGVLLDPGLELGLVLSLGIGLSRTAVVCNSNKIPFFCVV